VLLDAILAVVVQVTVVQVIDVAVVLDDRVAAAGPVLVGWKASCIMHHRLEGILHHLNPDAQIVHSSFGQVLRTEGLIVRRREGTHVYYALADRHVADLIHNALEHAAELEAGPGPTDEEGDAGFFRAEPVRSR
jgi:G3E family GTPase